MNGFVHKHPGQRHNRRRHRRREQHRLALLRHLLEDFLDIGEEPEVQHFVGFVEHQDGDVGEVELTVLAQVQQPAGRADDAVGSLAELSDLFLEGMAAANRRHA